jgi:hypothetical protein
MFGITGTGFNIAKKLTNDGKVGRTGTPSLGFNDLTDSVLGSPLQFGSLGPDDDEPR